MYVRPMFWKVSALKFVPIFFLLGAERYAAVAVAGRAQAITNTVVRVAGEGNWILRCLRPRSGVNFVVRCVGKGFLVHRGKGGVSQVSCTAVP